MQKGNLVIVTKVICLAVALGVSQRLNAGTGLKLAADAKTNYVIVKPKNASKVDDLEE